MSTRKGLESCDCSDIVIGESGWSPIFQGMILEIKIVLSYAGDTAYAINVIRSLLQDSDP